jgi:hypothetical protein
MDIRQATLAMTQCDRAEFSAFALRDQFGWVMDVLAGRGTRVVLTAAHRSFRPACGNRIR